MTAEIKAGTENESKQNTKMVFVEVHLRSSQSYAMATRRPDPAFAKRVGRNLQTLRDAADLTQEALAEKIGVSSRYIQWIEAGVGLPSLTIADSLRRALKTDWNVLLG